MIKFIYYYYIQNRFYNGSQCKNNYLIVIYRGMDCSLIYRSIDEIILHFVTF